MALKYEESFRYTFKPFLLYQQVIINFFFKYHSEITVVNELTTLLKSGEKSSLQLSITGDQFKKIFF